MGKGAKCVSPNNTLCGTGGSVCRAARMPAAARVLGLQLARAGLLELARGGGEGGGGKPGKRGRPVQRVESVLVTNVSSLLPCTPLPMQRHTISEMLQSTESVVLMKLSIQPPKKIQYTSQSKFCTPATSQKRNNWVESPSQKNEIG